MANDILRLQPHIIPCFCINENILAKMSRICRNRTILFINNTIFKKKHTIIPLVVCSNTEIVDIFNIEFIWIITESDICIMYI